MRRRLSDDDLRRLKEVLLPEPEPDTPRWLEQATHRRVLVHTTSDDSVEGILQLAAEDGLLLWGAQMVVKGNRVKLDGEVFVPKGQVRFVQTVRM